jgi:putative CRISPR-associated protein (TIGR02619 family)
MMRFVLSTVGTSILTNLIDNSNPNEAIWRSVLRDSANLKQDQLQPETETVINTLADRALEKLLENDIKTNRRISAELNGIYAIYDGALPENNQDQHYLICTDTVQGQQTGKLIKDFLAGKGFQVDIFVPPDLSTRDTKSFTTGTKALIKWLEDNVPWRSDSGYQVIFNLVGGFKSLQGYMQTFGAFYADEIVYIFEGSTDLIRIPRLPIRIDTTIIETHLTEFALMAAGKVYPRRELKDIPETLLEFLEEGDDETDTGLSAWGNLIWNRAKEDLLGKGLLPFPRLAYARTFHNDFNRENDSKARLKLQETLATVTYTLEKDGGHTSGLTGGSLNYERLHGSEGRAGIHTFRVTQAIRVSCTVAQSGLTLRHYGGHDYVYKNP